MKIERKLKVQFRKKIYKQYEVKVPNSTGLNIKIIGISFDYSENDLIEKLRKQNSKLADANIKFMRKYETNRGNTTFFNVRNYGKIMEEIKLNVGWERCRVYDGSMYERQRIQSYNQRM